jgi:uncharacterized protein with NRDE domain
MCTLLVWKNVHPEYPVVVTANRDEDERRPSTRPQVLSREPRVVGGLDQQGGGTWLAVSSLGYLVALTNRRGAGKHDPSKRSRGRLVTDLAGRAGLTDAQSRLREIDAREFNPFVLLALDNHSGFAAHGGEGGLDVALLSDGAHAVTNWDLDSERDQKARRALELARAFPLATTGAGALAPALHALLQYHEDGPNGRDGGLCVHLPHAHYGTRSSAIVLLGATPAATMYYYGEGHPCEGELEDVTSLLTV